MSEGNSHKANHQVEPRIVAPLEPSKRAVPSSRTNSPEQEGERIFTRLAYEQTHKQASPSDFLELPLSDEDVTRVMEACVMRREVRFDLHYAPFQCEDSRGEPRVKNRVVSGLTGHYSRFLDAVWAAEGVSESVTEPKPVIEEHKVHELQVLLPEGGIMRKHGHDAAEVFALIPPGACGDFAGRRQIMDYTLSDNSLCFRVSLPTLVRTAKGSSTYGKADEEWERAIREDQVQKVITRRTLPHAFRNQRHWDGVHAFHQYVKHVLYTSPEFDRLRNMSRCVLQSVLHYGMWENPIASGWKNALDGIMNLEATGLSRELRLSCRLEELSCLYKSRKLFLKDSVDAMKGALDATDRFCLPAEPLNEFATLGLDLYAAQLSRFLASQESRHESWRRGFVDHQGGAGVYATRADGGRAAEAHLIVALRRLSRGGSSPLTGVFGDVTCDDLEALIAQVEQQEAHREEILDACVWFLGLTAEWPKCMYAIFPEREAKMRTFLILDYAEQYVGRVTIAPIREFLRTVPFCQAAFNGQKTAGSSYDQACRDAARDGDWQLFADASCATDGFEFETSRRILAPLRGYVPDVALDACLSMLSPRLIAATDSRPPSNTIAGFRARSEVLADASGAPLAQLEFQLREPTTIVTDSTVRAQMTLTPGLVPDVRLRRHLDRIVDALRVSRVLVVKAETGSGKTILFSTLTDCIIQMPSVAALYMLVASLKHFGRESSVYFSLRKDPIVPGVPVLTTGAFVSILAPRYPNRLVVLDEAESPQEDPMLNLVASRSWWNSTVIMSATPDSLRLGEGITRLDLHTPSPHEVTMEDMLESRMLDFLRTGAYEKALVVVHSEPFARQLALRVNGVALTADTRADGEGLAALCAASKILISTNIVRASVTLPGLSHVFDYGIKYAEVDFARQGFMSLVITAVSDDERVQLRGRVGRVGPGTYVKVTHDIDYFPHVPIVCARMPKVAHFLEKGRQIDELPLRACHGSVLCERLTLRLCHAMLGVPPGGLLPLYVKASRVMGDQQDFCAMMSALEFSGLLGRTQGLRNSTTPPEQAAFLAVQELQKASIDAYPALLLRVFDALCQVPAFSTQTQIMRRWLSERVDEDAVDFVTGAKAVGELRVFTPDAQFSNPTVQRFLLVFGWRAVVRAASAETYQGVFRDLHVRRLPNDPPLAVLFGVSIRDSVLTYTLAVPVSEADVAAVADCLREQTLHCGITPEALELRLSESIDLLELKHVSDEVYEAASLNGLHYSRKTIEKRGRARYRGVLSVETNGRRDIARPQDLPGIMQQMLQFSLGICKTEPRMTSKGMPMSWIVSFPVLNSVNYAASLAAHEISRRVDPTFTRNESYGFGDDLAAKGSELFCRVSMHCRESLGLQTNVHSTGYFHPSLLRPGERALGVFCEVVYDPLSGNMLSPPKHRALLSLARAMAPSRYTSSRDCYLADVQGIENALRRTNPALLRDLPLDDDARQEKAVRSTYSRSVLRQTFFGALRGREAVLTPAAAKQFLEVVEPFILSVAPSTKGTPARTLPPRNMPLVIGAETAFKFLAAIERVHDVPRLDLCTTNLDALLDPVTNQRFQTADDLHRLGFHLSVVRCRRSNWQGGESLAESDGGA